MGAILRRLESGERWWAAEIVLRAIGLALLGLCAFLTLWLGRIAGRAPLIRLPAFSELAAAAAAVLCWSFGWALTVVGPGLFRLEPVPRSHGFSSDWTLDHDRFDVAGRAFGADAADARLRAPVRTELNR